MVRSVYNAMALAISNIKANFLHTFLSVLGIIIGVAALVGILSLIDGMEEYAHEQISKTTSLETVIIQSNVYTQIDGVRMRKDSLKVINYSIFESISSSITVPDTKHFISSNYPGLFKLNNSDSIEGGLMSFVNAEMRPDFELIKGRWLDKSDLEKKKQFIVVSKKLANEMIADTSQPVIGNTVEFKEMTYEIVGIVTEKKGKPGRAFVPFTLLSDEELHNNTPTYALLASSVENVPYIKSQAQDWLTQNYGSDQSDFRLITNESRVEQANQGFLMFRVVMGLIVGISVIVGGIGVMNVLTISVTERTREIGVRKAVGAKRKDILLQFLSESVTISAFGSFLGLILGALSTLAVVPIIRSITKAPFEAAFTLNTIFVISTVAIFIGVVFGTYPAMKASKLDPVDAIRHE